VIGEAAYLFVEAMAAAVPDVKRAAPTSMSQ
jgi:hypothetical protein